MDFKFNVVVNKNMKNKLEKRKIGRPPKSVIHKKFKLDTLYNFFKNMILIRRFEEKAGQLYGMGEIGGFCHLYIGQEAVVVGLHALLNEKDSLVTSYRDHGHMLSCGMDPKGVMSELTGRKDGYSKGKGGSMHMFSREKNFFGGHGIVGAQVPIGSGLAFAHKYKKDNGINLTYLGDGAINQGQVYETFNMAALWKLPIVFVIENNQYGMGTSVSRAAAGQNLFERGKAYGIPGMQIDGMDVLSVYSNSKEFIENVRSNKGPVILEMKTYRYRGHSMSDPAKYRTREEVDAIRKQSDPILQIRDVILRNGGNEATLNNIDKEIKKIIVEASNFALKSEEPSEEELYTNVLL